MSLAPAHSLHMSLPTAPKDQGLPDLPTQPTGSQGQPAAELVRTELRNSHTAHSPAGRMWRCMTELHRARTGMPSNPSSAQSWLKSHCPAAPTLGLRRVGSIPLLLSNSSKGAPPSLLAAGPISVSTLASRGHSFLPVSGSSSLLQDGSRADTFMPQMTQEVLLLF